VNTIKYALIVVYEPSNLIVKDYITFRKILHFFTYQLMSHNVIYTFPMKYKFSQYWSAYSVWDALTSMSFSLDERKQN